MRSGHNVTKKNGRSMGIKRLCWSLMLNRFIVAILIIFILVLIFVIKIVFIGTTGDLSQQANLSEHFKVFFSLYFGSSLSGNRSRPTERAEPVQEYRRNQGHR